MAKAICLGEILIDLIPTVTGTDLLEAPAFKKAPGGPLGNVAVGLARLGVKTSADMLFTPQEVDVDAPLAARLRISAPSA